MPTLYLIRGIPGSGKSSIAENMIKFGMADFHFEADQFFVTDYGYEFAPGLIGQAHQHYQWKTENALSDGYNVAVSNTSTTEKEVQVYQKIALQAGAKFVSIIVENRHEGVNVHNVPEDKITQMKNRFSVKL